MRAIANCACRWRAPIALCVEVTTLTRTGPGSGAIGGLRLSSSLEMRSLARNTTDFFGFFAMYAPTPHERQRTRSWLERHRFFGV